MARKFAGIIARAIIVTAFFFAFTCTPSTQPPVVECPTLLTGPYQPLGGCGLSVSRFNLTQIYSMLTAQPASKPQSNAAPVSSYAFGLSTGAKSLSLYPTEADGAMAAESPFGVGQREVDLIMRETENRLLASGAVQLEKSAYRAPPAVINIDTPWTGVRIYNFSNPGGPAILINTTCRYISTNAFFFIDDRNIAAMETYLAGYGAAFDAIWAINRAHFGSENDVDGNGKVIIIFSQELPDYDQYLLGYFYSSDKFTYNAVNNPYSNEGDIFYMTTHLPWQGDVVKGTLAHEFQHMIYFDEHIDLGVSSSYIWLNEALSQGAEFYNGYLTNHLNWIRNFLNNNYAGLSLTHWTSFNYGYGAIFIRYLIDRFGDAAVRNMCATNLVGIAAVESATGMDFNTLYNEFTLALVMSNTGDTADPRFNFTSLNLRTEQPAGRGGLIPSTSYTAGTYLSGSLLPYRLYFYNWTGEFGTMSLSGTYIKGTAFGLTY